jgi:CHAD domain-containing protein
MAESYLERELKFDVPEGFVLPELAGIGDPVARVESRLHQLRNEYFDTPDHALRKARLTLRRRTGGTDAGWHLKVPHGSAREEIRLPLDGAESVPAELADLLLGVRRGQPLRPIATLVTERRVIELLDAAGRQLAEVADDSVRATVAGEAVTASSWREVEVELGSGNEALLQQLAELLGGHDARPSASSSKLARALAGAEPAEPAGPLAAYLLEQQRALIAGDIALRRGDETVIHKTRVATRRFRSTLRSFGTLFEESAGQRLDGELRWYAGLLGGVRDRQVQQGKLLAMVDELDDTVLLGPVRARIERELARDQAEHWAELRQALSSPRYLDLLAAVSEFCQAPPVKSGSKARLRSMMRKADRKAAKRLAAALDRDDPELLHRARKAAKRARYAGELLQPLGGRRAGEQAARNESLQELLGEYQDSLVSAELLKRLATIAGTTPGENGFSYGLLYQRQLDRAAELRQQVARG